MKEKFTVIFLASILGAGWFNFAWAEECKFQYPGCAKCPPDAFPGRGKKTGVFIWKGCAPMGGRCEEPLDQGFLTLTGEERQKIIAETQEYTWGGRMFIAQNPVIALEIAEKSPWAALAFFEIYAAPKHGGAPVFAKSESTLIPMVKPSSLTAEKIQKVIRDWHAGRPPEEEGEEEKSEMGGVKIRSEWELRKTVNGAYLDIKISTQDAEFREISRISPNIRVHLLPQEGEPYEEGKESHWEAVDWEY